jgi:hypothetical protein
MGFVFAVLADGALLRLLTGLRNLRLALTVFARFSLAWLEYKIFGSTIRLSATNKIAHNAPLKARQELTESDMRIPPENWPNLHSLNCARASQVNQNSR